MSFSGLGIAVSGLNAAQTGLATTGHNLANIATAGYTRQQSIQKDSFYVKVGTIGTNTMVRGMGTDIAEIRQVRDKFLDIQFRQESSRLGYYNVNYNAGVEVENILGELEGEYSTQSVIHSMWDALNELSLNPSSIDARGIFVSTSITFVDKINTIYNDLVDYQHNLDDQVRDVVTRVNELVQIVADTNQLIRVAENTGDNANDYRDLRNNALDELSELIPLTVKQQNDGSVELQCEGNALLSGGNVFPLGLRYTGSDYSFVEPVFTYEKGILPADNTDARPLFVFDTPINSANNNDKGVLKSLLVTRGTRPENFYSKERVEASKPKITDLNPDGTPKYPGGVNDFQYRKDYSQYKEDLFNVENALIPSTMAKLDELFHKIVTLINDAMAPQVKDTSATSTDPAGLDGTQYFEIFVRKDKDRYDSTGAYNEEYPDDFYSLYTIGNIEINPALLDVEGYDKIPVSNSLPGTTEVDVDNNELMNDLLDKWNSPIVEFDDGEKKSINEAYVYIINSVATSTRESGSYVDQQEIIVTQLSNTRLAMSGVAQEEELTMMMKYQHAYNASARLVNAIDSMIDRIINGTGRVGR